MRELDVLPAAQEPQTPPPAYEPRAGRLPVTVHRMEGGLAAGAPEAPTPQRRRSDIEQAAARQGKDLHKLADDFRDRLALVRDAGLTTGDTLAFSRAVRTYLDRFLAEDAVVLTAAEKSALADIILRAAVGYGPLDSLPHDRSVSQIMVHGPDHGLIA